MWIDRSASADGPEDHVTRSARSVPDDSDAAGKDSGAAVSGDGPPHSSPASSDTALRTERFAAHLAKIEAIYHQYGVDHGHARVEKPEYETVSSGIRRIEAEDAEADRVGVDDRQKVDGRLAEAVKVAKVETLEASAATFQMIHEITAIRRPGDLTLAGLHTIGL